MRYLSIIFIYIFCLIPFLGFSQKKDYKNFDKAVRYNSAGNVEKAIKYANKVLKKNPEWNKPYLLLASIYANSKQIDLAVDYLLKVYNENNFEDVKGVEQIVRLYYLNGFYLDALFYAEKLKSYNGLDYTYPVEFERYIDNCQFAIDAIKNPVAFNPKNLGVNINSKYEEYLPAISIDGNTLVYSRRYERNNVLQEDFFISKKDNNFWLESKYYGDNLNTLGNEGAFSFGNNMAVFTACDRTDRIGSCDLYLLIDGRVYNAGNIINSESWDSQGCFSPDGRYLYFVSSRVGGYGGKDIWRSEITEEGFQNPENLGPKINTKYDEMSPFLHPDNLTFYFSSNGHVGMGDYDIYISRRKNSLEIWSDVKNLGYPINTYNTENSLVVANDGRTAYYTSNKDGFGLEDIFVFSLPEDIQADEISAIELEIITQNKGDEIVLKNVTFSSNSSQLDSSSFQELDKLILYLLKNPDLKIEIQGHTDNIGSEIDNLILSNQRAKSVYDYLIDKVNNELFYKGYGELMPFAGNESENNRSLNRRTSFVIIQ